MARDQIPSDWVLSSIIKLPEALTVFQAVSSLTDQSWGPGVRACVFVLGTTGF